MGSAASRLWASSAPTLALNDTCQRMRCLVACCGGEVHIDERDGPDVPEEEEEGDREDDASQTESELIETAV